MNEQVEIIYTQMFAPNPIPQSVKVLFDRTNFLASRIDAQMNIGALVLIAAIATMVKAPTAEQPEAGGTEIVDTNDMGTDVEPAQMKFNAEGDGYIAGPTGPMDAPNTPDVGRQAKRIEILQSMGKDELYAHAEEFYGLNANAFVGKKKGRPSKSDMNKVTRKQIIEKLLSMTPVK